MAKLSVLITYYNEKELLTECLKSLLSQAQGPDEILIYDDASSAKAEGYTLSDSRIRIIRGEKNEGPSFGRNVLLREATGDYIHFHDADDYFNPQWASKVRRAIESRNADAVWTEVRSHYESGEVAAEKVLGLINVTDHDSLIRYCIRNFMLVPAGTFRRNFVLKHGGYRHDLWQSEDYEFNVRMAVQVNCFELIHEPLVVIRLREKSRSRNQVETSQYALEAIKQLERELPEVYMADLADKAASIGRTLFLLGERKKAKGAFQLAREIGPARLKQEGVLYRFLARSLGQEYAEKLGVIYREKTPSFVRKWLR